MKPIPFNAIEKKWQKYWIENKTFACQEDPSKPKYYALDMFPYPSGEGLHVGHPVGYIASDIMARYKRNHQYSVLHPIGFDAFGLPAEQYAIQTGQHPAITTKKNSAQYTQQLQRLGFSFDWDRVLTTSDPEFYQWTQWIFWRCFHSWFNPINKKAEPIYTLTAIFKSNINKPITEKYNMPSLDYYKWYALNKFEKEEILNQYRLMYLADMTVNWCPALGTVLANDEVKDGFSERGGHPVVQKKMKQWCLRITPFADRLLEDLEKLRWPKSIKEIQKNWIGKSIGAEIMIHVRNVYEKFPIYTERPELIFGMTFVAIAPEHKSLFKITTPEQKKAVTDYVQHWKNQSEKKRKENDESISGVFTGTYAIHPFTRKNIPIYVAAYVLDNFGTYAHLGVPAHHVQDNVFAKKYAIDHRRVVKHAHKPDDSLPYLKLQGKMVQSEMLNELNPLEARKKIIIALHVQGLGKQKTNYRLRDAVVSRQRYWGEPFPVFYKHGHIPYTLDSEELPLPLPHMKDFRPSGDGKPPLSKIQNWKKNKFPLDVHTMPSWMGSSWYFFRFMDPFNKKDLVSAKRQKYWSNVDLYIGGAEHTTGHLLYARVITKILFDYKIVDVNEPFERYINQGMMQGKAYFVYRIKNTNQFVSYHLKDQYETTALYVHNRLVKNNILDTQGFQNWQPQFKNATFILENGDYICGSALEKMSKSKYNVVNPDEIIAQYSADTLRVYTMFLGPITHDKPWDTQGIEGSHRFLIKFWRLFHTDDHQWKVSKAPLNKQEKKILHNTIKNVNDHIIVFHFNNAISTLMTTVNFLHKHQCYKKEMLQPLLILLSPFAPHLAEELWEKLGHKSSIAFAPFPEWCLEEIKETHENYAVAINGKVRTSQKVLTGSSQETIENMVLKNEIVQKWIQKKTVEKIIFVPKKLINLIIV